MTVKPAPLKWAQRKDLVYLNFEVQDVVNPDVVIEKDKVIYRAETKDKQKYETILNLFGEIKPEESKWQNRDRGAEFVLIKNETTGPYWKRLLKEDTKYHWLKVDFNRWKDEDESDDEGGMGGGGDDFKEMMRQMGGFGGGGMGGMGGAGMPDMPPMGNFDDLDDDEKDSDDEAIPDLEDGDNNNKDKNDKKTNDQQKEEDKSKE